MSDQYRTGTTLVAARASVVVFSHTTGGGRAYLGAMVGFTLEWEGATVLAVISSPLEHGVLAEGATVAFDFPPATAHALPARKK